MKIFSETPEQIAIYYLLLEFGEMTDDDVLGTLQRVTTLDINALLSAGYAYRPSSPSSLKAIENNADEDIIRSTIEAFRLAWPGKTGSKPGREKFYKDFKKKFKHKTAQMAERLMPGLLREEEWRKKAAMANSSGANIFIPAWPMIQTWVNQQRFDADFPQIEHAFDPAYERYHKWCIERGYTPILSQNEYLSFTNKTGPFEGISFRHTDSSIRQAFISAHESKKVDLIKNL